VILSRGFVSRFIKRVAGKVEHQNIREAAAGMNGLYAAGLSARPAFNAGGLIDIGSIVNKADCQPRAQVDA